MKAAKQILKSMANGRLDSLHQLKRMYPEKSGQACPFDWFDKSEEQQQSLKQWLENPNRNSIFHWF